MFVVEKKHDSGAEARFDIARDLDGAAKAVLAYLKSYYFEIRERDGEPALYDEGNADASDGAYEIFDNVRWATTSGGQAFPTNFTHCHGDGPCLRVIETDVVQ